MATPGSNLLKRARKLIKFQSIQYYKSTGRTLNAARQYVDSWGAAEPLSASVQAVNKTRYAQFGLDFAKFYVQVWASLDIIDLQRDSSSDRFLHNGDLFQMENGQTWFEQDGWAQCLAVRIKMGATGPT